MRTTNTSGMLHSREIACADADCIIDDAKLEFLGRKRRSIGDRGAIIDTKEELNNVKWGLENY